MANLLITAVLSALFTVMLLGGIGWYLYQHHLRAKIDAAIDERLEIAGEMIEKRVRDGVVGAVEAVTSVDSMHRKVMKGQDRFISALFGINDDAK